MSDAIDTIAAHAADGYQDGYWYCRCNWHVVAVDRNSWLSAHAAHVVDMLGRAGITLIELPEADEDHAGHCTWGEEVSAFGGSGRVRCYLEDPRMASDEARSLAAALLAAADTAERNTP